MSESPRYTGTKIAPVLNVQGRKARWLAGKVGVSESMISKVSSGERMASEELAGKIADALGVEVGMLFELRERRDSESVMERVV